MNWYIKTFQELSTTELYKILMERTQVFVVEQNCPYLEVDGKDVKSYHLFAEHEGEMICYLRILSPGISYPQTSIGRVLVKKDYRGQGLGKELLRKSLNFIQEELKENKVKIQAQCYLEKFYSSFGFETISDEYLEDDIPHIDMLLQTSANETIG